jgi:hypothetical protein
MNQKTLAVGDVVTTDSDLGGRYWKIVLNITEEDIAQEEINANHAGLYLFYGMWYGSDPLDHRSYGKIEDFPSENPKTFFGDKLSGTSYTYIGHISQLDLELFRKHIS